MTPAPPTTRPGPSSCAALDKSPITRRAIPASSGSCTSQRSAFAVRVRSSTRPALSRLPLRSQLEAARPASGTTRASQYPADGWSSSAAARASGGSTTSRTGPRALARSRVKRVRSSKTSASKGSVDVRTSSTIVGARARFGRSASGGNPRSRTAACPPRLVTSSSSPGMSDDSPTSTATSRPCKTAGSTGIWPGFIETTMQVAQGGGAGLSAT